MFQFALLELKFKKEKGKMKKKLLIPAILIIAIFTAVVFNETILTKANAEPLPLPGLNIRVMQTGGSSPQANAQVLYKVGGTTVYDGRTGSNGWCYITLATATYDVYVYYPALPNDGQSGSLLNYYHDSDDNETIVLGPNY
ncbi:MAG: hypothetical protein ABIY50_10730 [Ignavibacteria bacterium]